MEEILESFSLSDWKQEHPELVEKFSMQVEEMQRVADGGTPSVVTLFAVRRLEDAAAMKKQAILAESRGASEEEPS